jgi:hypothetical protein
VGACRDDFTAEAKPIRSAAACAINTLFHEGGHAAHFANVVQNSPFSHEYPPTSMACGNAIDVLRPLLSDPDWMMRHASSAGQRFRVPHPDRIASSQPMRA